MVLVLLTLIVIAGAWYWVSTIRVSPTSAPVMPTRIVFPNLHLSDPAQALALLERPEEIVLPFEHATLVIDYPLTTPARVEITAPMPEGFTRAELVRAICEEYGNIYEAEEGTAATKTVPPEERALPHDRNRTDGAYGIWGYDLQDLVLTSARWTRDGDGAVTVELFVEGPRPGPAPEQLPSGS